MKPSKFEYLLTNAFLKLSKTTLALIKLKNIEKEHVPNVAETSIGSFDKEKLNKNEASNHVPAGLLNMF